MLVESNVKAVVHCMQDGNNKRKHCRTLEKVQVFSLSHQFLPLLSLTLSCAITRRWELEGLSGIA